MVFKGVVLFLPLERRPAKQVPPYFFGTHIISVSPPYFPIDIQAGPKPPLLRVLLFSLG